jgi:putative DNA primase/helicase
MSTAFWRRWLVVEFPNQFPPNEEFRRKLFNEILPEYASKILAYSLLLVAHVVREGRFSFEGSEVDYRELWLRETNSVYAFLQDMFKEGVLARDPEARVRTDELYSLYVRYCNREERESLAKREFTMELQRLGYPRVKVRGSYYYKGLKIVGELREGGLEGESEE